MCRCSSVVERTTHNRVVRSSTLRTGIVLSRSTPMNSQFVQNLHHFIKKHAMIKQGETVLIAVSGGADSIALLYGLHALQTQLSCKFHVVHIDHSLRQDSTDDAEFVLKQATHLEIPFSLQTIDVSQLSKEWKLSIETTARKARYEIYETVCAKTGATKIALGHHKDDIAETVLMNLIRGTGSNGLKGIAPIRDGKYIRPLATFTRKDIETYLKSIGIVPREDTTNEDKQFLRNRIRHELIPFLEQEYNPNIKNGLYRTAEILGSETEYLDTIAQEAYTECKQTVPDPASIVLDRQKFQANHIVLQRRILRHVVTETTGQLNDFSYDHCQVIIDIINGEKPNAKFTLPNQFVFKRSYQELVFERPNDEKNDYDYVYTLNIPGKTFLYNQNAEITASFVDIPSSSATSIPDGVNEAMFDCSKIDFPLTVRNRRQGDRFQPFGMKGTKKIKNFFIDEKVPQDQRSRVPLLLCGNEIMWVICFTTSEKFKILNTTKRCLHLQYEEF